jgi:hypothetical protein
MWCVIVAGSLLLYLRASQILTVGLAATAVAWAILSTTSAEDIESFVQQDSVATGLMNRVSSADAFSDRISYMANNFISGVTGHTLGEGMGLGQPGGHYAAYGVMHNAGSESEWGRIAFEVGPAGLLGVLAIRMGAILICWRALRVSKVASQRVVIATALPFFLVMSTGKMAFNHVGNSFAWAVMALALAAAMAIQPQRTAS